MTRLGDRITMERDPRTRAYIDPVRIVWRSPEDGAIENESALLEGRDGQSSLSAVDAFRMRTKMEPTGILLEDPA